MLSKKIKKQTCFYFFPVREKINSSDHFILISFNQRMPESLIYVHPIIYVDFSDQLVKKNHNGLRFLLRLKRHRHIDRVLATQRFSDSLATSSGSLRPWLSSIDYKFETRLHYHPVILIDILSWITRSHGYYHHLLSWPSLWIFQDKQIV